MVTVYFIDGYAKLQPTTMTASNWETGLFIATRYMREEEERRWWSAEIRDESDNLLAQILPDREDERSMIYKVIKGEDLNHA